MKELKSILSLSLIVTVIVLAFALLIQAGRYEDCIDRARLDYKGCQTQALLSTAGGLVGGALVGGPVGGILGALGMGALHVARCDTLYQLNLRFCERYANEFDWN